MIARWRTPSVTERPPRREAVTHDPFIDDVPCGGARTPAASRAPTRRTAASRRRTSDAQLAAFVDAARRGDGAAWRALVECLSPMMRRAASAYRLDPADVDDVVQGAWVELFERIRELREPAAVAGWLATTTRRRALRLLQGHLREQPTEDCGAGEAPFEEGPAERALARERRETLGRAIAALPERQRRLVSVLLTHPELDYAAVGELADMPVGSIGPIRARALDRLGRDAALRALHARAAARPPAAPASPPLVGVAAGTRRDD